MLSPKQCGMREMLQHLNFIIQQSGSIIYKYDKDHVNRISYFYLGLLERLHSAGKSLVMLIEAMDKDRSMEFSAGLVIRTLLLDFLLCLRGYDILEQEKAAGKSAEEVEASVTAYCNSVFGDSLIHTFSNLRNLHQAGIYTEDQMFEGFRMLAHNYSPFLEPYKEDGKPPISRFPRGPKVIDLFLSLAQQPDLKRLASNYESYVFYSKYEHFGILSYTLMRRLEHDQIQTLARSIELLAMHAFISIQTMSYFTPDQLLNEALNEIGEYVTSNILKAE